MTDLVDRVRDMFLDLERDPDAAVAAIGDLYAEDMVFRDPIQEVHGRDGFVEVTRRLVQRMRGLEVRVHEGVGSGEALFVAWTMTGAMPLTPRVTVDGVSRLRVQGGRIVHHRDYFDLAGSAFDALPGVRGLYRAAVRVLG